jgi:hypothetical protein
MERTMQNQTTIDTDSNPQAFRQTVYDRNTYTYAQTPEIKVNEGKPPVASRLNLPLDADGPATCLVYFITN